MIEKIGYIILAAAFATALAVVYFKRDRLSVYCAMYFGLYEALTLSLMALDKFEMKVYAPLAIIIDCIFFYKFLERKSHLASIAVGLSAIYGGITLWQIHNGILLFYSGYEYMAIATSILILWSGINRGLRYKYNSGPGSINSAVRSSKDGTDADIIKISEVERRCHQSKG